MQRIGKLTLHYYQVRRLLRVRNFSEEEYQIIYQAYVTEGRGMLYTSKLVNSTPNTVKRFLKSKGIIFVLKAKRLLFPIRIEPRRRILIILRDSAQIWLGY